MVVHIIMMFNTLYIRVRGGLVLRVLGLLRLAPVGVEGDANLPALASSELTLYREKERERERERERE